MKNVFECVKDRLGMGPEPMYYHHAKAKRIAAAAAYIAQEVFVKNPLRMSALDFYNAALIYRTVHLENEGIYNGKVPFDATMNKQRGIYSLKVAEECGIELSEVQKEVIKGDVQSLEADIIKLAETIVAVRYQRVQRGVSKAPVTNFEELETELNNDARINAELLKLLEGSSLKYWFEYEEIIQIGLESKIFLLEHQ